MGVGEKERGRRSEKGRVKGRGRERENALNGMHVILHVKYS